MKVQELIERLKDFPQDYEIWLYDESDSFPIEDIRITHERVPSGPQVSLIFDCFFNA